MPKFTVFMQVHGTAAFTIEATSKEEAKEIAEDEHEGESITLCHHCNGKLCDDPTVGDVTEVIEDSP